MSWEKCALNGTFRYKAFFRRKTGLPSPPFENQKSTPKVGVFVFLRRLRWKIYSNSFAALMPTTPITKHVMVRYLYLD